MAQWVSFKTIKEQVGIEQILEHYGLLQDAKRKGHELRILCPFHEETQPSFTAHTQKNGFHCFGCSAKADIEQPLTGRNLIKPTDLFPK